MSFKDLGVNDAICEAVQRIKWDKPTEIQRQAIPHALAGRDIVGTAKTGSGKTGAFTIPIVQALMVERRPYFALVLTPTRELALQIQNEFLAIGKDIGLICVTLIGGGSEENQAKLLDKKPHIIIASPGRFLKHLRTTKGFNADSLKNLRFLVMDEADKILSNSFDREINDILYTLPRNRRTFLFSATNTDKVEKLQRASVKNPIFVSVDEKYSENDLLKQFMFTVPFHLREVYLVWLLKQLFAMSPPTPLRLEGFEFLNISERTGKRKPLVIIFVETKKKSNQLTLMLHRLGFSAAAINADMSQEQRVATIHKMKTKSVDIMVATDVASRGIDIHNVDVVINYDLPETPKTYMHRVGRTARAGRTGIAITLIHNYNALMWVKHEEKLSRRLPLFVNAEEHNKLYQEISGDEKVVLQIYNDSIADIDKARSGKSKRRAFNVVDKFQDSKIKRRKLKH